MATITLAVERIADEAEAEPKEKDDDRASSAGLDGWLDALRDLRHRRSPPSSAPCSPGWSLALVLAIPGWPLVRRLRRRRQPLPSPAA